MKPDDLRFDFGEGAELVSRKAFTPAQLPKSARARRQWFEEHAARCRAGGIMETAEIVARAVNRLHPRSDTESDLLTRGALRDGLQHLARHPPRPRKVAALAGPGDRLLQTIKWDYSVPGHKTRIRAADLTLPDVVAKMRELGDHGTSSLNHRDLIRHLMEIALPAGFGEPGAKLGECLARAEALAIAAEAADRLGERKS